MLGGMLPGLAGGALERALAAAPLAVATTAAVTLADVGNWLMAIGVWFGLITLYFSPAIVAYSRGHDRQKFIFYFNLLMGWTVLGWLIAGLWSVTVIDPKRAKPPFWDKPRKQG